MGNYRPIRAQIEKFKNIYNGKPMSELKDILKKWIPSTTEVVWKSYPGCPSTVYLPSTSTVFTKKEVTFATAMSECETLGGWLAYPRSQSEWEVLRAIADDSTFKRYDSTWVGLREKHGSAWVTAHDGDDVTSTVSSFIENGHLIHPPGSMLYFTNSLFHGPLWRDPSNTAEHYFICAKLACDI